jgi:hypothetical protein
MPMTIRWTGVALAAGLALAACSDMSEMMGGKQSFTADLTGGQEVPPVTTTGRGSATATLDGSTLEYTVQFSGLSGPPTAAHFHGPAAPGQNAGVQVNIGQAAGLTSPMKGRAQLTDKQIADLKAGRMYINVHTANHTDGEIRGQVVTAK